MAILPRSLRPALEALALAALVVPVVAGCNYSLRGGGGFPSHIETIYIAPFENETVQFQLQQQLFTALIEEVPSALGIRTSGESTADAVLRGRIVRYDDVVANIRPRANRVPQVLTHRVTIAVEAEVIDVENNVILWEARGISGHGNYRPGQELDRVGRAEAIDDLVQQVIEGARSQW